MSFTVVFETAVGKVLAVSGSEGVVPFLSQHPDGVVVSCLKEDEHANVKLRFPFPDDIGGFSRSEQLEAKQAAALVARGLTSRHVLVYCREGRNRSPLVVALALVELWGCGRKEALALLDERRSPALTSGRVLSNPYFRQFLLTGEVQ